MSWVTEEEIQAAKNMTAYEYLRTHQAQRLQKTRTRNEWQLTDHDSFKINELSSKWHWKSRDIGGVSALRFLIEVDGMKFEAYEIDAFMKRADMYYTYKDAVLTILMYKEETGTAKGNIKDGNTNDEFEIPSRIGTIKAIEIEGAMDKKYMTEFIYDNTYYHIYGELPKEEFINLISSIFF